MKNKQLYLVLACTFYAISVFQIFEKGFDVFSIIMMGLGSIMLSLSANKNSK